jgi:serine/threonine protein kinase
MICPKCDTDNRPDSKFCRECATSLTPADDIQPSFTKTIEIPFKTLTRGTLFTDRYEIIKELGIGGMGRVYLAQDQVLDRKVAIKILQERFDENSQVGQRFLREAKAAAALDHPFICKIYDTGEFEGSAFFVMEYVEGESLSYKLKNKELSLRDSIRLALEISDALEKAHERGIIHRDLKPSNIMLTLDQHVKVMDFGIAKILAPNEDTVDREPNLSKLTREGTVLGTPAYMSPEQLRGLPVEPTSDIFSFGIVFYEMITGAHPFQRDLPVDTMSAILDKGFPPLSEYIRNPPERLESLIANMLDKKPPQRYQSISEVKTDLNILLESTAGTRVALATRSKRKRTPLLALGAISILAIAAVLFFVFIKGNRVSSEPPSITQPQPFITEVDVSQSNPSWSPLGNQIAFSSNRSGNLDIWICDPSGSNPINITPDSKANDTFPVWSPDGLRIAFKSSRGAPGIYTMTTTGGEVKKVIDLRSPEWLDMTWSRDNRLIYCDRHTSGRLNIFSISPSGTDHRCLTDFLGGRRQGELSPSGELLVCRDDANTNSVIDILHLRSGKIESLTMMGVRPSWNSRGDEIFFLSLQEGYQNLWSVRVDPKSGRQRGDPYPRTLSLNISYYSLSPDDHSALITRTITRANIWLFPLLASGLPDFENGQKLTSGNFRDSNPRFVMGREEICFISDRRGSSDVWKLSLQQSQSDPVRLTSGEVNFNYITVSPNGRWIAASSQNVYLMRSDGSGYRVLEPFGDEYPETWIDAWSQDGRYISFSRWSYRAIKEASMMKENIVSVGVASVDVEKGEILDLVPPGFQWEDSVKNGHTTSISPDGRYICYQSLEAGNFDIWIASLDGKDVRQLTTNEGDERSPLWVRNPSAIYFVIGYGEKPGVYRVLMGEEGNPLGEPEFCFKMSDGMRHYWRFKGQDFTHDKALFSLPESESEIWLIELNGQS